MHPDELRELENSRRKTIWALAEILPGDPKAADTLVVLDDLDDKDRSNTPSAGAPVEINEVRDSVQVQQHQSGIDLVLEATIPQPWRERFPSGKHRVDQVG